MGLFFPVVSSSLAAFFFYFGMIQRAPWDSRVQFATTLTWRLGVPAFAPALAHQHGVPFAGASSVLVFASVAAHDRRYICRELCMIDFAACWLLSMALASMATSVCRARRWMEVAWAPGSCTQLASAGAWRLTRAPRWQLTRIKTAVDSNRTHWARGSSSQRAGWGGASVWAEG